VHTTIKINTNVTVGYRGDGADEYKKGLTIKGTGEKKPEPPMTQDYD